MQWVLPWSHPFSEAPLKRGAVEAVQPVPALTLFWEGKCRIPAPADPPEFRLVPCPENPTYSETGGAEPQPSPGNCGKEKIVRAKRTGGNPDGENVLHWHLLCLCAFLLGLLPAGSSFRVARAAETETGPLVQSILDSADNRGGVCVLLGWDHAGLAFELSERGSWLIHCLHPDRELVDEVRKAIQSRGSYGTVSADCTPAEQLPYAENLVNLIVADHLPVLAKEGFSIDEVLRVLAPKGIAYLGDSASSEGKASPWVQQLRAEANAAGIDNLEVISVGGTWVKIVKPRPKEIDDWTHWLHGADCNAVAEDTVVGPPRHVQWVEKPVWQRHHDTVPNVTAVVSADGRLFSMVDEALIGIDNMPDRWFLTARDAFNGALLWKRPIAHWDWRHWSEHSLGKFNLPLHIPRRLVAVGDRVYVTLGLNAPLTSLDAATGATVRTYRGTEFTDEILYHEGILILSVNRGPQKPGWVKDDPPDKKRILAIEADTGKLLWEQGDFVGIASKTDDLERITHLTLAVGGGHVVFLEEDAIVCLDLKTGAEQWRASRPTRKELPRYRGFRSDNLCSLVVCDGIVLFCQPLETYERRLWNNPTKSGLLAISAETGKTLWTRDCGTWGPLMPPNVFVIDGLVWVHDGTSFSRLGLDPRTGEVKRKFSSDKALNQEHHHRCYRNKATQRFILSGRRGVEFTDLKSGENLIHHWVRGTCRFGIVPCNGLLYAPPHPCVCYITAKLNGFYALAPELPSEYRNRKSPGGPRFVAGPAYDAVTLEEDVSGTESWATYRHDPLRSSSTESVVPAELDRLWQTELGGRLTAPVIAKDKVFVASVDEHRVCALDAKEGEPVWSYTGGGRVDTPPTIYRGLALFGSADGCVYCLRACDGQLVWRRRATPEDRRIIAFEQLESAWPVHGGVLVKDGVTYYCAGRSSFLDGGIYVYAVDPKTGNVLQERRFYSPDPETGEMGECRLPYDMPDDAPGALPDVLVSDVNHIYMRHVQIDPTDLNRPLPRATIPSLGKRGREHPAVGPQLMASSGLLDDSWFNQTYWTVDAESHSKLLVFDAASAYGVKPFAGNRRHSRAIFKPGTKGYTLFCNDRRQNRAIWSVNVPLRIVAMVLAGEVLFVAGPPDVVDPTDPWGSFEGKKGSVLWAVSAKDGRKLAEYRFDALPVFDGMAAAGRRLYVSTTGGKVLCFGTLVKSL